MKAVGRGVERDAGARRDVRCRARLRSPQKNTTELPIALLSGTVLALRRPRQESHMGVILSTVGIVLIAAGVVGSAMTMRREGPRF